MEVIVAYNYRFWLTDRVRPNGQPALINEITEEAYTDLDDFVMSCVLRYAGICKHYPTAEMYWDSPVDMCVVVEGREVYRKTLIGIDPVPQVMVDFEDVEA